MGVFYTTVIHESRVLPNKTQIEKANYLMKLKL